MPARPFSADLRVDPGAATIVLGGDVTLAAQEQLSDAYARSAATRASTVVLDFSDVDYINSTGIALIVRLLADARRDGREVRAVGLSPHYVEVFEITRLSDYMQIISGAGSERGAASESGARSASSRAIPAGRGGQA